MRTALFAAVVALFTLACGDVGDPPIPASMPGCNGESWCAPQEACYTREASVRVLGTELALVPGFQGGHHVDVPVEVTGLGLGGWVELAFVSEGQVLESYEGAAWFFEYDGCRGTVRWMPDWQAGDVFDARGEGPYEMVMVAHTWAGAIEARATVTIAAPEW